MSSKFRKVAMTLAVLATTALIAVGCGSDSSSSSSSNDGKLAKNQVLTLNIGADNGEGIDPPKTSYVNSVNIVNQMFAGLYQNDDDYNLVPYLATDQPEVSDDGLTYTVKMRDDAKWSDGKPVTAEDAVFGAQYSLRNATAAYFAQYMLDIVGARKFNADKSPKADPSGVGVKALDEHTVEYKLERPVPWFKGLLALQTFYPLRQDVIEKYGDKWTTPENIVTDGPFTLESYTPKDSIVLKKSDTYWDAKDVKLTKIIMKVIENPATGLSEFKKNRIDASFPRIIVLPTEIGKLKGTDEYRSTQTTAEQYLYLNTTSPALKDRKVRQALALAVDREAIVKTVTRRGDKPASSFVAMAIPGSDVWSEGSQDFIPTTGAPDYDKAKELLKEGGWKDGTSLSAYYATESSSAAALLENIQDSWAKIGVDLKLVPTPGDAMQQVGIGISPIESKVNVLAQGWAADYPDAQNYYQLMTCENIDNGLNGSNYCNPEYDKVYNEALKTVDDDARFELYKKLEAILTGPDGDMPAIPLYEPTDDTLVHTWVKGFHLSPTSLLYFENVEILDH